MPPSLGGWASYHLKTALGGPTKWSQVCPLGSDAEPIVSFEPRIGQSNASDVAFWRCGKPKGDARSALFASASVRNEPAGSKVSSYPETSNAVVGTGCCLQTSCKARDTTRCTKPIGDDRQAIEP